MNIAIALASPSISSTWPSASAERLTTMYSENARLRRAGSGSALSQLSITVYSPTSAMPVAMRSTPQATGCSQRGCSSTAIAARAAKNANARICPMRPISEGAKKVPMKKPAKYPDITSPSVPAPKPAWPPRTASRVPRSPLPVSSSATPVSKAVSRSMRAA